MGTPRSPGHRSRTARVAVTKARVRTLTIAAVVIGAGVSFALVASAVSSLKAASGFGGQNALQQPRPEDGTDVVLPLADARAGTSLPESAAGTVTPAAPGAASPPAAGAGLSKAQAIALVQGRYRARVVRTTLSQDKGGRRLYVFRLLSGSGKVWTVRIDAQTGAELP